MRCLDIMGFLYKGAVIVPLVVNQIGNELVMLVVSLLCSR